MRDKKNVFKAGGVFSVFTVGVVVAVLFTLNIANVAVNRDWHAFGDYNPGSGAAGFLRIGTCAHSATPGTTYATNVSSWYEYTDSAGSAEMTGETPSDTAFDFVFKFRTNVTVNYASNNDTWVAAWVRAYIDINFDFDTDVVNQQINIVEVAHNAQYAWYQAYIQDSNGGTGDGFTIANNEKFTIDWFRADGYY